MGLDSEQLIALITEQRWGMPVQDMEGLINLGDEAVSLLVAFLQDQEPSDDEGVDLLWPVVILGELHACTAVPVLISVLKESHGVELPVAAAEALAKIGMEAMGPLEELLGQEADPRTRTLVYAALAHMGLPEAWEILEDALEEDPELDFAVARGLAIRNLPEDQARVYGAYEKAEPWKRSSLEETLVGMISGRPPWATLYGDWRLRYRRQPRQGLQIPLTWPAMMILMLQARQDLRHSGTGKGPLSLDQLTDLARQHQEETRCPDCRQSLRSPTGVPLCDETEESLITFQLERVQDWLADRWEDIHEVLDELDHQEMNALERPEETEEERAHKWEALETLDVMKRTLSWMVEAGVTGLSHGEKRLSAALDAARIRGNGGKGV
jgi:hypothetical protein